MREGGSSLDNAGAGQYCQMARVRLARRRGVRVQKPVVEPPQERGPARTWWIWAGIAVRRDSLQPGGATWRRLRSMSGATVKACGVAVDRPAGEKLGTDPVYRSVVNVGTAVELPSVLSGQGETGKVRRRLMARQRDGALVVVRGRESRPHGEGTQRVRKEVAGMSGGRR